MSQYSPHQSVINYNAHGKQDRLLLGVLLMAIGETFLVMMGATIKHVTAELPLTQVIFFRNFFALAFVLPLVTKLGLHQLKSSNMSIHFQRGLYGVTSMLCLYYSFSTLKLTEAVLLKSTSPIFLSLIAWFILRERLPLISWLAIFLAFFGVVVIVNPSAMSTTIQLGFLLGFTSALLAALAKIMVRRLGRTESSEVIVFYFGLFGAVLSLPFAVWFWQPVQLYQWGFLVLIALLATMGQLCVTKAYTVAKAGKVAMFSYLSMPIAGGMGWLLWNESITTPLVLGSLVIIVAGVMSVYASRNS